MSISPAASRDWASWALPWICSSRPGCRFSSATWAGCRRTGSWSGSLGLGQAVGGHVLRQAVQDAGEGMVGHLRPVPREVLVGTAAEQERVRLAEPRCRPAGRTPRPVRHEPATPREPVAGVLVRGPRALGDAVERQELCQPASSSTIPTRAGSQLHPVALVRGDVPQGSALPAARRRHRRRGTLRRGRSDSHAWCSRSHAPRVDLRPLPRRLHTWPAVPVVCVGLAWPTRRDRYRETSAGPLKLICRGRASSSRAPRPEGGGERRLP